MKILIAEDDENMSKILKLYLQREGYSVDVVFNGKDTISYLEENQVDLLLLDWMLPYKSGIEICQEIKTLDIPVKIIMITAKTTSLSYISLKVYTNFGILPTYRNKH